MSEFSGAKHVSRLTAGHCPYFKLAERTSGEQVGYQQKENPIERGEKEHKAFLPTLGNALRAAGFNCLTSDDEIAKSDFAVWDDRLKIKGLPDAVCTKGDLVIIFEYKSYPLAYAELSDMNQLAIYYTLLSRKFPSKRFVPVLVYSDGGRTGDFVTIPIMGEEVKVPKAKYLILRDIDTEFVERALEIFMSSRKVEGYVISSRDCGRCKNMSCIVKTGGLYGRS